MARILVVEDSATQAQAVRIVLEASGFEVDSAPNGEAGLARIVEGGVDLVLSDVVMPRMDGHELCRAIRASPETRGLPVILFTSLGDPFAVLEALESGADNFLTKPCEPDTLVSRVNAVLEGRRLRAEGHLRSGSEIYLRGRRFSIDSDRDRVLDLLVTTLDDTVQKHRELAASQERLVSANRELEAFSYSVAHDLGAQLRALDGFSRLLLGSTRAELPGDMRNWLNHINEAAQRMRQIIDDLMRLSHVVRSGLDEQAVDLADIARTVADDLRRHHPGHAPHVSIPDTLPALGDPGLLRVLLENLLGNAWKFTRRVDAPAIVIGARSERRGPTWFVRDNGAGFDMRFASKLFLPFERLHSEAEFKGTGIGLTTARRIVERHGGRIWAESELGRGATFFFTLGEGQRERTVTDR